MYTYLVRTIGNAGRAMWGRTPRGSLTASDRESTRSVGWICRFVALPDRIVAAARPLRRSAVVCPVLAQNRNWPVCHEK